MSVIINPYAAKAPFDPLTDLPNLRHFHDETSVVSSGGRSSQWTDLSGTNRHLTQPTAGLRPYFDGIRSQNGLDVVEYKGDGASSGQFFQAVSKPLPAACSVFIACALDTTAQEQGLFGHIQNQPGTSEYDLWTQSSSPSYRAYPGDRADVIDTNPTLDTNFHIYSMHWESGNCDIMIDNTIIGSNSSTGQQPTYSTFPWFVGALNLDFGFGSVSLHTMDAIMGQFVATTGRASDTNITNTINAMISKWGVTP